MEEEGYGFSRSEKKIYRTNYVFNMSEKQICRTKLVNEKGTGMEIDYG